jgi:hypothetical protein
VVEIVATYINLDRIPSCLVLEHMKEVNSYLLHNSMAANDDLCFS